MSWKPLLSPALRTTLQKIAAAYGVSVDALIDAALRPWPDTAPGAVLAAKALSPETLAELRAIPRPEEPPHEVLPVLPDLAPHELLDLAPPTPVPPDVVITVDGVHLTCPCVLTHAELRSRIASEIPHLVVDETRPLDLHLLRDGWRSPVAGRLSLFDGDVLSTHADPRQEHAVKVHLGILASLLSTDMAAQIEATIGMMAVPLARTVKRKVLLSYTLRACFTSLEHAMQELAASVGRQFRARFPDLPIAAAVVDTLRIEPAGEIASTITCWLMIEASGDHAVTMVSEPAGTIPALTDELAMRDEEEAKAEAERDRAGTPFMGFSRGDDGVMVDLSTLSRAEAKALIQRRLNKAQEEPPPAA